MAKSKRAAALFEVIHSGKDADRTLLSTPRWWFKKKDKQTAKPSTAPAEPASAELDPTAPQQSPDVPRHSSDDHPHGSGLDVAVDRDRQLITFKFSFTSAIVMGFAIVVAVSLAFIVGKKMSRGPSPAIASQTTEQLRAGQPNPDVLDLSTVRNPSPRIEREPEEATTSRGLVDTPDTGVDPNIDTVNTAPAATKRTVNLNYVVIQSYPDEKSAIEARDALQKAGIGCTIEQKLRGFTASWYTVVGTQGFDRVRANPDYDAYMKKIMSVSEQHSRNKRSFKAFGPMAYKWDKQ